MTDFTAMQPVTTGTLMPSAIPIKALDCATQQLENGHQMIRIQVLIAGSEPGFVYMDPDIALTWAENLARRARIAHAMNQPAREA